MIKSKRFFSFYLQTQRVNLYRRALPFKIEAHYNFSLIEKLIILFLEWNVIQIIPRLCFNIRLYSNMHINFSRDLIRKFIYSIEIYKSILITSTLKKQVWQLITDRDSWSLNLTLIIQKIRKLVTIFLVGGQNFNFWQSRF